MNWVPRPWFGKKLGHSSNRKSAVKARFRTSKTYLKNAIINDTNEWYLGAIGKKSTKKGLQSHFKWRRHCMSHQNSPCQRAGITGNLVYAVFKSGQQQPKTRKYFMWECIGVKKNVGKMPFIEIRIFNLFILSPRKYPVLWNVDEIK